MPGFEGYDITHNKDGSITFLCTPSQPGTYKISVELDGCPLSGLPVCCVVQETTDGYVTAYKSGLEIDEELSDHAALLTENNSGAVEQSTEVTQLLEESFPEEIFSVCHTFDSIQSQEEEGQDGGEDEKSAALQNDMSESVDLNEEQQLNPSEPTDTDIVEIQQIKHEPEDIEEIPISPVRGRQPSYRKITLPLKYRDNASPAPAYTRSAVSNKEPDPKPPKEPDVPCPDCGKLFLSKSKMMKHQSSHVERILICDVLDCKKQFKLQKTLEEHRKLKHNVTDEVMYDSVPCSFKGCPKKFESVEKMKTHLNDDHTDDQERICPMCHRVCRNQAKLKEHLQTHSEEKTFTCDIEGCDKRFRTKRLLESHKQYHDGGALCAHCGKSFVSKGNLNKHIEHIHTAPKVKKIPASGFRMPELSRNEEISMMCDTCGRFFKTRNSLKNHIREMHLMESTKVEVDGKKLPFRPFVCKYCGKGFKRHAVMKAHTAVHESVSQLQCSFEDCEKRFPTIHKLKDHIRMVHKPEGEHRCAVPGCNKVFKRASNLKVHMRKHNNERFACQDESCNLTFSTKFCMLTHYRLKHEQSAPKHSCSFCGKEFKLKLQLDRHVEIHSNTRKHHCSTCGKSFKTKNTLISHKKIHSTDLQHSCHICGRSFTRKQRLNDHLATHTSETKEIAVEVQDAINELRNATGKHVLIIEQIDLPEGMEL